jgi:hypothetical protein
MAGALYLATLLSSFNAAAITVAQMEFAEVLSIAGPGGAV